MGFFTDTSVCIGCKACEVACKEWNRCRTTASSFTGMSYDNTQALGARHLAPRGVRGAAQPPTAVRRRTADGAIRRLLAG